jgi:hypothetical protein
VGGGRRLRIHDGALKEAQEAARRYEDDRRGLGVDFTLAVDRAIERIVEAPQRWPVVLGAQRYVLPRFPFSIYYRLIDEAVYVVAIAPDRRRPGYWSRRR